MQVTKGALPKILLDTMYSSGFTQVLKEPTYRTLNGDDHFLDLVFVSDPSFVISCNSTYNLNGCDHSAVSLLLNTCHIKGDPIITKPVYCLNRADFDKMKCFLVNGLRNYVLIIMLILMLFGMGLKVSLRTVLIILFLRKMCLNLSLCHG